MRFTKFLWKECRQRDIIKMKKRERTEDKKYTAKKTGQGA